jgi:hypothetical protein
MFEIFRKDRRIGQFGGDYDRCRGAPLIIDIAPLPAISIIAAKP